MWQFAILAGVEEMDIQRTETGDCRLRALKSSAFIVSGYVVLAGLWIAFSDQVVGLMASNVDDVKRLQTFKGFGFVAASGSLLLWLCYTRFFAVYRTKMKLGESTRKFQNLLTNLPGMAYRCLHNEHWTMQFVSEGCRELTGYATDKLLSSRVTYEGMIHPEDREIVRQQVTDAVEQRKPFQMEYRICTAKGETRWVWESGRGVFDNDQNLLALEGFIMDIHERKYAQHIEAERNHFQKQVESRDQALSIVAHELRSPLAGIRAVSELLLTDSMTDASEVTKLLESMNGETIRMSEMIDDMLESARLNSGRTRWDWKPVSLQSICDDAVGVVQPLIDQNTIRLSASVEPDDLMMYGDEDAMRRVLVNLLSNAGRYTKRGSITVTAWTDGDDESSKVHVRVQDTGSGIPAEMADSLGVPFALNKRGRGTDEKYGTGLGLAICKQIVSAHGGRIRVQSRLGVGTSFELVFPRGQSEPVSVDEPHPIQFEEAA